MGLFRSPLLDSVLVGIGMEQGVLFWRYRRAAGAGNTTLAGFSQWKHLLRLQSRVNVPHGVLGLAGVPAFYAAANIPHIGPVGIFVFALPVIASLFYEIANLAHRNPPLPQADAPTRPDRGPSQVIPDQGPMVTRTGRVLTDADVDAMSDQANREWEAGHQS